MDVYARCGGRCGTVRLQCEPSDTVADLKQRLPSGGCGAADVALSYAGRVCKDGASLGSLEAGRVCFVDVFLRVRGGGGDGGSTGAESRASYLEMYATKKPDKVNPEEETLARWTTCRLSGERLAPPVCADELGSLYNKSAIVAALVAKTLPPWLGHISSLRHLIDLKPERSSPSKGAGRSGANGSTTGDFQIRQGADFHCPLTGLPMNGRYRFFAFRKSGLVLSEKALKEVPAAVEELVGGKWVQDDLLPLNGSAAKVAALRKRMLLARTAAKTKKEKRKAVAAGKADVGGVAAADAPGSSSSPAAAAAVANGSAGAHANGKRSAAADAGLADERAQAKRFKATKIAPAHANKQVWASIFTSSRPEAKETYGCRALSSRGLV